MSALLKSISVTDFRSIRGTLSIPLDAPVILVHGQNGTGKTSLLSALELALTGKVPSLYRSDEDYLDHLVHKEAVDAHVHVTVDPSILARADCSIRVHRAQLIGDALLPAPLSAFFNERCYLAQSTMNRLLEIYEGKESRSADSALTKFVKDLLGLDQLDALVNGLFEAGDQRRLKSALAPYKLTLDRLAELKLQINRLNSEIKIADADTTTAEQRVAGELTRLGYQFNQDLTLSGMQDIAVDPSDEVALQQTALLRRNVGAALEQWSSLQTILTGSALSDAEFTGTETANLLAAWRQKEGAEINRVFVALRNTFSDLPDPELVGPAKAINEASQAVVKELRRCEDLLNRDVNTSKTLSDLDERLGVTRARLLSLEQQIAGHFEGGGQLAQSLSALLPHIKSEECPVCGRDYSEISDQSLQSHLSQTIASLVESSGRLQAFVRERTEAIRLQSQAEREKAELGGSQLDVDVRNSLSRRKADLDELQTTLSNLVVPGVEGERLILAASNAAKHLADVRNRSSQAATFRHGFSEFEVALGLHAAQENESTDLVLARFKATVEDREKYLTDRVTARSSLNRSLKDMTLQKARRERLKGELSVAEGLRVRLSDEISDFETKMLQARELTKIARLVRSEIVRKVFNDSLNILWRELFIRLAPSESFVPAFVLPEKESGEVEAELETHYRSGGRGGNPRAMLSAGNLNTAALTLFLALHLSVDPKLRCLIVDDPVQSMDEVHIAQLAALLRVLSRQHDRQMVIAVHEKQLFDYLSLELFPAFEGDRLITVELSKNAEGESFAQHQIITYKRDTALDAA